MVVRRKGLLRYALEGHTHAGGGGGGGGSSPYKGTWSVATAYAVGDIVKWAKALWCANTAHTGTTPAIATSIAGSLQYTSDSNLGASPAGQEFTTNATKTYTGVKVYANTGSIPSGSAVYLRSTVGGADLASGTLPSAASPGAPVLVTFSSPVTLAAGTYWLLLAGNSAAIISRGLTVKSGVISAIGRFWFGSGWSNTALETTYSLKFDLYAQDASVWDLVVQGV